MAITAASAQCERPIRYLDPERFRLISHAQYTTFGIAPASNSGSQITLIALSSLAPKERATSINGVPKATPKFISDAQRPHRIASSSPREVRFCEELDWELALSLILPAAAQSITPIRMSAIEPSTAYPAALVRDSRCRDNIGIRLPTAADVPRTIENASVIPIISTARPKKTCATPQPAPNPQTSRMMSGDAER